MEEAEWLSSSWGESENTRRAKFYRLTNAETRQLKHETDQWARISAAMASALRNVLTEGASNHMRHRLKTLWRNLIHKQTIEDDPTQELHSYQTMLTDEKL